MPLEGDEVGDPVRMAALWAHLPRDSRTVSRRAPDARWSDGEWMLWAVEFGVRRIAWMLSADGSKGRNRPRPLETPGEVAEARRKAESALSSRDEIDRILGMGV